MKLSKLNVAYLVLFFFILIVSCKKESQRLNAVKSFADNVLEKGVDQWSGKNTPLLADGINVDTNKPLEYVYDGSIGVKGQGGAPNSWIMHNLASQQNLFRTLVGLSNLTGDEKYRSAAEKSIRFHFDSLRSECGLLRWGGHQIIDLRTMEPVGHSWRKNFHNHELKNVFPFYELMCDVDKKATADFIRAFWNAHVRDWGKLDFNRHGSYGKKMDNLWDNEFEDPGPFYKTSVLTFLNTGSDLIYAGATLSVLNEEKDGLRWAKLLAKQYVKARHPETGLGAVQYGEQIRHEQPPEGPLTGTLTWTTYGDRAENQFGKDFPDVAREPWVLFDGHIYNVPALVQLELSETLGPEGDEFLRWTVDGLKAYAKYAYEPAGNYFRPMWADETDLTGYVFPRTGYYGKKGKVLNSTKGNELYLFTYARAFRLSKDKEIWEVVRSMMKGLQFGDPGAYGGSPELNMDTGNSDANALFALIELSRAVDDPAYLDLAEVIGNNILKRSFHKGFFLRYKDQAEASFDVTEPLALLSLEAALQGKSKMVPVYSGGRNGLSLKTE